MKLSYRGVSYSSNPTVIATGESEVAGKYRGSSLKFHVAKTVNTAQRKNYRTYRGVQY